MLKPEYWKMIAIMVPIAFLCNGCFTYISSLPEERLNRRTILLRFSRRPLSSSRIIIIRRFLRRIRRRLNRSGRSTVTIPATQKVRSTAPEPNQERRMKRKTLTANPKSNDLKAGAPGADPTGRITKTDHF
ncbi:MAG: hypothetical protein QUS35_07950 [bacterium]|nr:hypothetical protein [bacterium]